MSQYTQIVFEGELIGGEAQLSLEELCRLCDVEQQRIVELVEEGVLQVDPRAGPWQFTGPALRRARMALRLQRDLQINVAGVALVLELVDELERLRRQIPGY